MKRASIYITCVWFLACAVGLSVAIGYSYIPGAVPQHLRRPASSQLTEIGKPQLLLFLHPRCSCSKATVSELSRILPELKDTAVTVVFNNPTADPRWTEGELWTQVQALPKVRLVNDLGGVETKLYQVQTSGHAVLTDANGAIVFSGGITPSRGHQGESEGKTFLQSWEKLQTKESLFSKVFGCGLFKETT